MWNCISVFENLIWFQTSFISINDTLKCHNSKPTQLKSFMLYSVLTLCLALVVIYICLELDLWKWNKINVAAMFVVCGRMVNWIYEKKIETVMVNNSTNINEMNNRFSTQTIQHKKRS